jgi:hypothetical protein
MASKRIAIHIRLELYNTVVVSNALNGCQTGISNRRQSEAYLRGSSTNTSSSMIVPLECRIHQMQLRYFGHVVCESADDNIASYYSQVARHLRAGSRKHAPSLAFQSPPRVSGRQLQQTKYSGDGRTKWMRARPDATVLHQSGALTNRTCHK